MRNAAVIAIALLASACGGAKDTSSSTQEAALAIATNAAAAAPDVAATPFPQPGETMSGLANPDAPPDVAQHVARQERCAHWRGEQDGGSSLPAVTEGLARECTGIDAQLADLRARHAGNGAAMKAMRPFGPVE